MALGTIYETYSDTFVHLPIYLSFCHTDLNPASLITHPRTVDCHLIVSIKLLHSLAFITSYLMSSLKNTWLCYVSSMAWHTRFQLNVFSELALPSHCGTYSFSQTAVCFQVRHWEVKHGSLIPPHAVNDRLSVNHYFIQLEYRIFINL